jgi:hypothetical protein
VDGYKDLQADVKKQQVTVTYDPAKTNPEALAKAITEGTEFKATPVPKAAT